MQTFIQNTLRQVSPQRNGVFSTIRLRTEQYTLRSFELVFKGFEELSKRKTFS